MFSVSCSEEIQRPPQVVFAFAGDYSNDPLWRTTRETMRSLGRTAVTVGEITDYSSARTAFRSLSGPVPCAGSREFVASAAGTRFTYSLTIRPAGFLRVLEPLLRLVLARQARTDLRRLKHLLEAQS